MNYKIAALIFLFWSQLASANLLDVEFRKLAGTETVNLADQYGGMVTLVVNTASKCGYTPQISGLDDLYHEIAE